MTEYRAHFDAEIAFANGGDLRARGFRLDLPSNRVTEADIAELLVRHLGLALVASVEFSNLAIVEEPHRGSRGVATAGGAGAEASVSLKTSARRPTSVSSARLARSPPCA